jgi:mono/diheme cytochrome c family protein
MSFISNIDPVDAVNSEPYIPHAFMATNRIRLVLLVVFAVCFHGILLAQNAPPELKLDTGEDIFKAACIGCHGPGGKGQPQSTLGFEPPATFPDFSDCNGSTREKTYDWRATIHGGGRARGFVEIMPSFAEALNAEQIGKVVQYLRDQCPEKQWPLGELNLPRSLVTEKAFPEDEYVLTSSVKADGPGEVASALIYEKRFGARNQLEFAVPFSFIHQENASWVGGIGDFVLGYKRTLIANRRSGSILSLQGEVALPTGNKTRGLGSGFTLFETFAAFGQILPKRSFIQIQTGAELPADTEKAPRAGFFRTSIGKTFAQNQGFGRIWTPMIEFLADRDFESGARTNWDLVPQMQVSLSKRQHVLANFGVLTPANNRTGRSTQLVFYVLWDFFDGGLREGW